MMTHIQSWHGRLRIMIHMILEAGMNDHDYVNFSEDYEMNYHLRKVDKRQTESNRGTLRVMGTELKSRTGKSRLTHGEFHPYVSNQSYRLE